MTSNPEDKVIEVLTDFVADNIHPRGSAHVARAIKTHLSQAGYEIRPKGVDDKIDDLQKAVMFATVALNVLAKPKELDKEPSIALEGVRLAAQCALEGLATLMHEAGQAIDPPAKKL